MYCSKSEHEMIIEIDGESKEYKVSFDFSRDEGYSDGTHFHPPEYDIANEDMTIHKVEAFDDEGDIYEIDIDRMPASWAKQFREAVDSYALENLEE